MELYSKEELLKELKKEYSCGGECDHCPEVLDAGSCSVLRCIRRIIDNIQPVEPEKVLFANVTFDEDKLKEIVQTEVIDKIKNGEIVLKDERPQGEWTIGYTVKQKKVAVCNLCNCISFQGKTNFCHNCGAKMLKGGAEE